MINFSDIKAWSEIIQSIFTSLALAAGGAWTYYNYIYKRERYPRASVQIYASSIAESEWTYLLTKIIIKNIGQLLLPVKRVVARVQQVSPLIHEYVPQYHPDSNGVVLDWRTLTERAKEVEAGMLELEPNEIHEIDFEFLLPANIRIVKITAYIPNVRKAKQGIGWLASSIHLIEL
jgi:hypothetical protein